MKYLKNKVVRTRKKHQCWGCAIKYPKGTIMRVCIDTENGKIESAYWCKICQEYCARYMHPEDELSLGEIYSEDKKTWEALKKTIGGAENGSSKDK